MKFLPLILLVLLIAPNSQSEECNIPEGTVQLIHIEGQPIQGETITMALVVNTGPKVLGAYNLTIKYNKNHCKILSATRGTECMTKPITNSSTDGVIILNAINNYSFNDPKGVILLAKISWAVKSKAIEQSEFTIIIHSILDSHFKKLTIKPSSTNIKLNQSKRSAVQCWELYQ